jgi:hypothetical protein
MISQQLPVSDHQETVILSRRRRIYLNSYPDVSGFRIFLSRRSVSEDGCIPPVPTEALCEGGWFIKNMFLRNEPNFLNCKMTVSHFLLIPYASGVRPERVKTNPFLPLLRHATRTPFSPPKSSISPKSPSKSPFIPLSAAKIRTQKRHKTPP